MTEAKSLPTGVAAGRVDHGPKPGPEHARLSALIGRWMTEGHTLRPDGTPDIAIVASDVYEWLPGGFFVVHSAYGRIGDVGAGGLEIIGYDPASRRYPIHFFDSLGNATRHELVIEGRTWTWRGQNARCTGVFSEDGKTMTARHERTDDGSTWVRSMDVTLRKVE